MEAATVGVSPGRVWWGDDSLETPDLTTLHAKIGQLALGNDLLAGALIKAGGMRSAKP